MRRSVRIAAGLCLAVLVALTAVLVVRATASDGSKTSSATRYGPIAVGPSGQCRSAYNRQTLRTISWAADATVEQISEDPDGTHAVLNVHRWYRGRARPRIWARLPSPTSESGPPVYGNGTRLLVAGSFRGRTYSGWACGFIRYYDSDTARAWGRWLS